MSSTQEGVPRHYWTFTTRKRYGSTFYMPKPTVGDEHWQWVAEAPIEEIISWVEAGTR